MVCIPEKIPNKDIQAADYRLVYRDFYCARAKLVIELDGSQHYTSQGLAYDRERTAMLSKYDLSVLRFTNYDIDHHFDAVCRRIDNEIQTRISLTFGESSPTTDHH